MSGKQAKAKRKSAAKATAKMVAVPVGNPVAVPETIVSPQMRRVLLMDEIDEMHRLRKENRILVHRSYGNAAAERHCALLPVDIVGNAMKDANWDLQPSDGFPGFSALGKDVEYHRFGGNIESGIEPLVFLRDYSEFVPAHLELSEEFRHYHNLYHNAGKGEYVKYDKSGIPSTVAEIKVGSDEAREVWIRAREIRQFLAAKHMALAVSFWIVRIETELAISDIPEESQEEKVRNEDLTYDFRVWHDPNVSPGQGGLISRLYGKALIAPPHMEEAGMWPFDNSNNEEFQRFWTRELVSGEDVRLSCNPDKLGGPFLSVVVFRSAVLDKYRNTDGFDVLQTGIYRGLMRHLGIIFQDSGYVVVHLGELESLPEADRLHWAAHNIRHSEWGRAWRNDDQYDLPRLRESVNQAWKHEHGWPLFRLLEKGDDHHSHCLHIPAGDGQKEFGEQILSLAILLIESLNVDKMREVTNKTADGQGGLTIKIFRAVLDELHIGDERERERWVSFLKGLQEIRSSGVAHAKQEHRYSKALSDMDVSSGDLKGGFAKILMEAMAYLRWLHANCRRA